MVCWALPVLAAASCGFPDYSYRGNDSAGGAGGGSSGNAGASTGGDTTLVDAGGSSGSAGAGNASGADGGDSGFGGQAETPCSPIAPKRPATCFDGEQSAPETDVDCGGGACQPCFKGACVNDSDCATGSCTSNLCTAPFTVQYEPLQTQDLAPSISFRVTLTYAKGKPLVDLKTLSLRYYFHRNAVAEPLTIPMHTTTLNINSASSEISADTLWEIIRTADGSNGDFDAFIQIRFTASHYLSPGDSFVADQTLVPGNAATTFDQRTHYSYGVGNGKDWDKITAYVGGQLVWGYEPRGAAQASCFAQAVDFNGPAVTDGANAWASDNASQIVTNGSAFSQGASLYPDASGPLAQVIQTGYTLNSTGHLTVPVPNGQYLAYVYAFSNGGFALGTLSLQGVAVDNFQGGSVSGNQTWGRLGPYPITVQDASVKLGCSKGTLSLSGLELRWPGTASY